MVTIHLKVNMCRDTIANSNITKLFVVNPCDSCNTDVNTPLKGTCIHVYSDYVISYVQSTYIVYTHIKACVIINLLRNDRVLVNDVITSAAHAQTLSN